MIQNRKSADRHPYMDKQFSSKLQRDSAEKGQSVQQTVLEQLDTCMQEHKLRSIFYPYTKLTQNRS